ncbi:MAG: ATP-dependent helicase [Flavobacteriales bacterium]|nr:ATP-dependent helicase [Flavobacteriales bacterium]
MDAFEQIANHIENNRSFVLEAGAGSGKTYTLIQTLNYLIKNKGEKIRYNNQKIICITYTNVAKNEIIERLEHNPIILVSTIHEFLWDCIKSYQKQLKIELCKLNEIRYNEDFTNGKDSKYLPDLSERIGKIISVNYDDTAFRDFEKGQLHHNDVISLSEMMFRNNILLTNILAQKHPYILVDEYQDTATEIISALIDFLLIRNQNKIVLGFYGDSYQKIYDTGVGDLEKYYTDEDSKLLELVKKEENYRSSRAVVDLLNNFRTNIRQIPQKDLEGSVKFVYCTYSPSRTPKINKKTGEIIYKNGEIDFEEKITEYERRIELPKNENYDKLVDSLIKKGWNFKENSLDKILVLANSRVAKRANFGGLYQVYSTRNSLTVKDQLLDRNHYLIKYFTGYVDKKTSQEREIGLEHLIYFSESKNDNEVIRFLKKQGSLLDVEFRHILKTQIGEILKELIEKRKTKTIGEVFNFIQEKKIMRTPDSFYKLKERISIDIDTIEEGADKERIKKDKLLYDSFMNLPYSQVINFFNHTQNKTVFSTKHGTKGDEYRNVLTVIDDTEWKVEYNFENFFNGKEEKPERRLRTRNLFYVECSRAKENLVVLALSEMNQVAIENLKKWFGEKNVLSIEEFLAV